MPRTTTITLITTAVTSNGTNSIVTLPPRVTVQITVAIVIVLVFAILVVITTIIIICLAYKCKKNREGLVVADNSLSLDLSESIYTNVKTNINGVINAHVADQVHSDGIADQDIHRDVDKRDISPHACVNKNGVRYERVESNLSHFMRPLHDVQEESEAHYEQVPSKTTSNKRELKSDSKLPSAHHYAVSMGDAGTGSTVTSAQLQEQGGETRYGTIVMYQQAVNFTKKQPHTR